MSDPTHFMRHALTCAQRTLGQTWPNPAVGAVIVNDNTIIGEGWTQAGGRPHAETEALKQAGDNTKGATLYVTLEPCSHHGRTPPCVDAVIAAGITTVVSAVRDPNPKVNGQGIARLREAGINVIEGVCGEEARQVNEGFFSVIQKGRPFIALKIATSADEKIAYPNHTPRWITGEESRRYGHVLRSQYDAIATGIGTVLADNPTLDCRIEGSEHRSPVRVVFDSGLRLPTESNLVRTAKEIPLWVLTGPNPVTPNAMRDLLSYEEDSSGRPKSNKKITLFPLPSLTVDKAVEALTQQGITRLLIEGGQKLTTAFLESGLIDRIYWFRAPVTIGEAGLPATDQSSRLSLQSFYVAQEKRLGDDTLVIMQRRPE